MSLIPGSIPVTGFIAPTDTADTYPVTDAIYGIDGLRNVPTYTDMYNVSLERRREGMIVGVMSDNTYWKLLPSTGSNIWNLGSASNWQEFAIFGGNNIAVQNQYYISSTEKVVVPTYSQYWVYGDLTIAGELENYGQVIIANGGLVLSGGTFSGMTGSLSFVTVIQGVTAGAGMTGGGQSEYITLSVDYSAVSTQLSGNGLINNGTTIDVNAGLGLTVSGDLVQVSSSIAGTGLTFSSGVLSVVAGSSQPVYQIGLTTSVTTGETGILLSSTPNDYSRIQVFVNGQLQMLGDGVTSRDCHFGTTTSAVGLSSLASGSQLVWNSSNAGFSLSTSDKIDIVYES